MKKLLLTSISLAFFLTACSNPSTPTKKCKVKPNMTSKQIEKVINWKYCEGDKI